MVCGGAKRLGLGAKRLGGQKGGETTRGEKTRGETVLGAKRLVTLEDEYAEYPSIFEVFY